MFPHASITHLQAVNSDHIPILLNTISCCVSNPKPLRFESMWSRDPIAATVIARAWEIVSTSSPIQILLSTLTYTKMALKSWNRSTFGHVQTKIKILTKHIEAIQNLSIIQPTLEREAEAQLELNELLKEEEILLKDKSKTKWIVEGDANTRYFHISTIIKCKVNAIEHIKLPYYIWIHDREHVGATFVNYYCDLFSCISPIFPNDLYDYILPSVIHAENLKHCRIPEDSEIKCALFSMGAHKSPSPDGFNPFFSRRHIGQ